MKTRALIALLCLNSFISLAQEDSLTQVEYDTIVVNQPPVIINRKVLSLPTKVKLERQLFSGISIGINYFTSIYHTCKGCGKYDAYANTVEISQPENPGINMTAYMHRNLTRKLFFESTIGYSLYTEQFQASGIQSTNYYQQLGISESILYQLYNAEKSKVFVGVGGNLHYLLSASGKTVTIFNPEVVSDMNSFRVLNKFLGGAQVSTHWFKQVSENWFLLLTPVVAFEITSFTSYYEYYLQNRFLYSLNLGFIKKI